MNLKFNKQILLILLCLFSLSFFSCKSTEVPIPGQSSIVLQNVYKEYVKLGDSYYSIEKYNDAIDCYKIALEDKSLYWPCYYKIAKSYVLMSDWGNALTMFETLLENDPDNSSLKASIAYIYSMAGDFNSALKYYDEIIQKQPTDEKYLENYLAILLSDKNIFIENKDDFEKSFDSFKKNFPKNENIELFNKTYEEFIK